MSEGQIHRAAFWALALIGLLAVGACASQPPGQPLAPGFLTGLWHGVIAPIAFLVSLVDEDVRMYAFPNAGRWYDFGYLIGLSLWGGGASVSASARR